MKQAAQDPTTLVICCGAVAREIVGLVSENGWTHIRVECLPAHLHNSAAHIPEGVRAKIRANRDRYDEILVLYQALVEVGGLRAVRVLQEIASRKSLLFQRKKTSRLGRLAEISLKGMKR